MRPNPNPHSLYQNPLVHRYASKQMSRLFSPQKKIITWRKLWIALAEALQQQNANVSNAQIQQMHNQLENIDFELAAKNEKLLRHDVMAHIHTFAAVCPLAAPIIHLGATSCFVTDNAELIIMREALALLQIKLKSILQALAEFSKTYIHTPTLAYTHFQPAQPTTVGKRAALWLQELLMDFNEIKSLIHSLPFRGLKGASGTQASFLTLLKTNEKIDLADQSIAKKFDFKKIVPISGQTYSRKWDDRIANSLSAIAQSCSKFANDLRLLQHKKEIEEPFQINQIGSSAMPYKRNPMQAERINSIARFVFALPNSTAYTASTQWLERSLDDSANKRISLHQGFLAVDALLELMRNLTKNLVVYPKMIEKNLLEELPFLIIENLLMEAVKKGGNRQTLHEKLRKHSINASKSIKEYAKPNPLLSMLAQDPDFPLQKKDLLKFQKPDFIQSLLGRSIDLTQRFLNQEITPVLNAPLPNEDALKQENIYV